MRSKKFAWLPLVVAALVCPVILHAQFQQPTDEELKMTADPKAPGSAAVYLDREEVTDNFNHFYMFYVRIKVLSEKGKELATVHVPYVKGPSSVTDIQARTIHPDGAIVPLSGKPTDLVEFKTKEYQINTMVFTLPSVEVGSILEYRLKIRGSDASVSEPHWDIQQPFFIHRARFMYHPSIAAGQYVADQNGNSLDRFTYTERLPPGVHVAHNNSKDEYSLDLTDIPAIPEDDWMPPINTLKWHVNFYYTNAITGAAFWLDAAKHWARRADAFTTPSRDIKAAVAGIVSPTDTDEQKAQKIYAAVQKLDNSDFSRKLSEAERKQERLRDIRNADDVWKQKSGTGNEMALLYIALARAAGLRVYPAQVVDRNEAMFDITYFNAGQLDDYLAIVVLDGKEVFLDPGQKMCPFGSLNWKHSFASGFRASDKEPAPVTTPPGNYKGAVMQRVGQLFLAPDGSLTGSVRFVMSGPDALHWRQMTLENDQDEVKKRFNESMREQFPDGVHADFDHFLALDDYTVNLIAVVKVSGNLGTATGKHVFLPGLFFESRNKHPFVSQDKRTTPIDVHYAKTEEDDVTYHLPAGFTIESAPQAADASWPNRAVLKIASTSASDSVDIKRTLVYNFTVLEPKDYPDLHDFYQKVATADQQQLVLTRTPAAQGN